MATTEADTPDHILRRGARLILRSIRAMPRAHGIAISGALVFAVAAVGLSRVLGWVTDEIIVPALDEDGVSTGRVFVGIGLIVLTGVLRGGGAVLRRFFLARARFGTERHWRRQLFEQYMRLPLQFHQARSTGELLAHADNDITVASGVLMPFAFAAATVVLVLIAVVSLFLIHPLLAVVAVVIFPLLAVMNQFYTRVVEAPATQAQEAVGRVSAIAHESFDGALVVKALGRERAEGERFRTAAEQLRERRVVVGRLRARFEPAIDALPNLGIIALLAIGSFLVDQGTVSVGDLVGAMALFTILALPMRMVGFLLQEIPRSVVALERVDGVLRVTLPERAAGTRSLPTGPLGVVFDDIQVAYEDAPVLTGVTFSADPGEAVAIVGATGSGKSTLARLLVDLQPPDRGEVRVGGVPVVALDPSQRAGAVAVALQESFLFADTIAENVALSRDLTPGAIEESLRQAGVLEFVKRLPHGVETVVGERGVTLSGGQRQRVALARALAGGPRVLFLDDATAGVDPVVEARILDNLRHELDLTLVVVAHRLSTIALADRIVFLEGGKVAGSGTHLELMALPAYAAVARAYEADGPLR